MAKVRIQGRKYCHAGREPKVLFMVKDIPYMGHVTHFGKKGLSVRMESDIQVKEDDPISRLYFDSLGTDKVIEGMRVIRKTFNETTCKYQVSMYVPDSKVEKQFSAAFNQLWKQHRPKIIVALNV